MSSFTFGFVTSKLQKFNGDGLKITEAKDSTVLSQPEIDIWTLADRQIRLEVRNFLIFRCLRTYSSY